MYFGNQLMPFIPKLAVSDGSQPFAEQADIDDPLRSAVITTNGELAPRFQ